MTKEAIARAFSNGAFEKTYDFISDTAEWTVVEEAVYQGRRAIMEQCEKVSAYFKTVDTDFNTFHVIDGGNKVVVNGTAEFLRDNKRVSFIAACDIYEFNAEGQLQYITSYCIQKK